MSERTAEDWGRVAVGLPGWRWMPGMVWCLPSSAPGPMKGRMIGDDPSGLLLSVGWPDLGDPATAGCLLAMLGPCEVAYDDDDPLCGPWSVAIPHHFRMAPTIGRACIAAAEALGRWPGGD